MIDPESLDLVARTVLAEAGNQGPIGQAAVAHVIRNRLLSGRHGQSGADVVLEKKQFEPWNVPGGRNDPMRYSPDDPKLRAAMEMVKQVFAGSMRDPTGGADHFYSPGGQRAMGRSDPAWARGKQGTRIGGHMFYNLNGSPGGGTGGGPTTAGFAAPKMPAGVPGIPQTPSPYAGLTTLGSSAPGGMGYSDVTSGKDVNGGPDTGVGGGGPTIAGPATAPNTMSPFMGLPKPPGDTAPPLARLLFGEGGLPGMLNRTIGKGPMDGKGLIGGPLQGLFSGLSGQAANAASTPALGGLTSAAGGAAGAGGAMAGIPGLSALASLFALI